MIHLLDTGPLVAFLNSRDQHHHWAREVLDAVPAPIRTCDAVIAEACHLLRLVPGGAVAVLGLVEAGIVVPDFPLTSEAVAVRRLMAKYADVPMSLADASLVRMTELSADSRVVTLDSDFRTYRRHRRQQIPVWMPD
ncbi:MAG TPA: PIN domain-containing protein [Gemmatimonadales bacterium]|nr:PIN domain-containing protein [Gemmatimonadales bacterium]